MTAEAKRTFIELSETPPFVIGGRGTPLQRQANAPLYIERKVFRLEVRRSPPREKHPFKNFSRFSQVLQKDADVPV
jgi:hypothetical protein